MQAQIVKQLGLIVGQTTPTYSSLDARKIFSPATRFMAKNSLGRQLSTDQITTFNKSGSYLYDDGGSKQYLQKITKFIQQYDDVGGKLDKFTFLLAQKIKNARNQSKNYCLQQLSDYFPWLMSCQMLFQPLRTIIYCIANQLSTKDTDNVIGLVGTQSLNFQVNRVILNSVRSNGSVLQAARQILANQKMGVLTKGWISWMNKTKAAGLSVQDAVYRLGQVMRQLPLIGSIGKVAISSASAIIQAMWSMVKGFGSGVAWVGRIIASLFKDSQEYKKQKEQRLKRAIDQKYSGEKYFTEDELKEFGGQQMLQKYLHLLADDLIKGLRNYGSLVINFSYVKATALKKNIQGKVLYYYPQQPSIMLGLNNSFATVYRYFDNNLVQIPQESFDIGYMRKVAENHIYIYGQRMMTSIQRDIVLTKQQKEGRQQFAGKYLNVKLNPSLKLNNKVNAQKYLDQIANQKSIKDTLRKKRKI